MPEITQHTSRVTGNKLKDFSWDWVLLLPSLEVLSLEYNRIERITAFLSKDSCAPRQPLQL